MKWDSRIVGLIIGLIAPIIIVFGVNVFNFPSLGFFEFLEHSYSIGSLSTWLKPAVIFNLAPFMLFINMNKMRISQGIVFATIFYALVIVYFMFA